MKLSKWILISELQLVLIVSVAFIFVVSQDKDFVGEVKEVYEGEIPRSTSAVPSDPIVIEEEGEILEDPIIEESYEFLIGSEELSISAKMDYSDITFGNYSGEIMVVEMTDEQFAQKVIINKLYIERVEDNEDQMIIHLNPEADRCLADEEDTE